MKKSSIIVIIVCAVLFTGIIAGSVLIYPILKDGFNMSDFIGTGNNKEDTLPSDAENEDENIADAADTSWAKGISVYDKDGNEVKLEDLSGKPVLLNFWATWCGYCIMEMPDLEEAYKKYGNEIQFLIVNTDDGIKNGEEFIKSKGYTFPTYYDLEYKAAIAYGITSIPRTIAIDKDGNVLYNQPGMLTADSLESIIEMIR